MSFITFLRRKGTLAYFDAWWFNNTQQNSDVLQPEFFTPKTHFGVYAELGELNFPFTLIFSARNENDSILYSKEFYIDNSENYVDFEIELKQKEGTFKLKSLSETLPELPSYIDIEYKDDKKEYKDTITCSYSRLHGRITDFSGKAFRAPLLMYRIGFDKNAYMGIWSKNDGEFSVIVPNGTYNAFFIDDDSYGETTLECWGWHMIVDRDERFEFKIGNGEVYSLHAWPSNGGLSTLFIYFRPMILPSLKKAEYELNINDRKFNIIDIAPELYIEDINIWINGICGEILSLQKIYETEQDDTGLLGLPGYVVQIRKNHTTTGKQTIILEYDTHERKRNDKNVILAQSQGYLQYFYHSGGTCIR